MKPVTFTGCLAPVQTAIRIGNDGCRIQIDVPETELANVLRLVTMREKSLQITIESNDPNDLKEDENGWME